MVRRCAAFFRAKPIVEASGPLIAHWHWGMEQQTVYDLAEKHDSSLDLIEKNMPGSDSVYDLTEIDT